MDYFGRLRQLLDIERDEDRQSYRRLTETASAAQRRESGVTWYPVAIRGQEMSRGDYLTVELERTTNKDIAHQFRFGATVALFSNHQADSDRIEGTISYQGGDRMKITLRTDELPDWASNGKLGVDLMFDEASYSEMYEALKTAELVQQKGTDGRLTRILTGAAAPDFNRPEPVSTPGLNDSQNAAVQKILAAVDIAIVHGPPGTGKTTTLVRAIKALHARDGKQLLVVAPSNTAVDLLTERLHDAGLNVLRVGNPVRVSEHLSALTLDGKMALHPAMKDIKRLKKQANEFRTMAHKYKRNFGRAEREQRKALFDEAHRIMKDVESTEQYISKDLFEKADVITATLIGANHYSVRHLRYETVVIDEAGQALEPACWVPILKGRKLILAGDHLQLPPTIKSDEAARAGLNTTLLEKCAGHHPEAVVMLEEQYRMNELIMGYSSETFYDNNLKAAPGVASQRLMPDEDPLTYIDTAGCGYEEKLEGTSVSNPEEAAFALKQLTALVERIHAAKPENYPSIGVISPYRKQVQLMAELLDSYPELKGYPGSLVVNTIDSFQGQERDVIVISMARSNSEGNIGFLADIRRMNVAMTRARKKLLVVGDGATLAEHPFYAGFNAYAEAHNAWHSAWEFMEL
jgi:ATP-dependent RNA/DNA helicase IGHMBP2